MEVSKTKEFYEKIIKEGKLFDYVNLETNYGTFVCPVSRLKLQLSNLVVKLNFDSTSIDCYSEIINSNFVIIRVSDVQNLTILKPIKVKKVQAELIYNNNDFKSGKLQSKWLRYILKNYGIKSNSVINCQQHSLAKIINLAFIRIKIDSLGNYNEVAKIDSNTEIEIIGEMDMEHFKALRDMSTHNLTNKLIYNEETELKLINLTNSMLKSGNTFSPKGFQGVKGFLVIDPTSFQVNKIIRKCIFQCGAIILPITPTEILRETIGESEILLKEKLSKATKWSAQSKVALIFEDMDSIFPKMQSGVSKRLLSIFLSFMDETLSSNLIIIGTLRSTNDLNSALFRPGRMDKKIIIGNLTFKERLKILKSLINEKRLSPEVKLEEIAEKTPGFGVPDLLNLWQYIVFTHLELIKCQEQSSKKIALATIKSALLAVRPTAYKSNSNWNIQISPIDWDEIAGMEKIKSRIKMAVEWPLLHSKAFKQLGLNPPKGVLLFGPPGCCKTTLIRGVASMCKATFLSATPAQIFSPYIGDSSKAIAEIFEAARLATPSLIFLDEIDSLVGSRQFDSKMNSTQRGPQEQVLSTLLNEMDGIGATVTPSPEKGNVIVIGVTNRFDLLDPALLRPGRFDTIVYVGEPKEEERKAILSKITHKLPIQGVNIEFLAQNTPLFSGADLKNLCQEAALKALDENLNSVLINETHFEYALKNTQPSLSLNQLNWFNEICQKNNVPIDK